MRRSNRHKTPNPPRITTPTEGTVGNPVTDVSETDRGGESEPLPDIDADNENWPWCECDLEPTTDEWQFNVCSHCGKPLT